MRSHLPYTALGLALVAGAPTAHAQTVFTRQFVDQPVETVIAQQLPVTVPAGTVVQPMQTVQPLQTVQTTETIRTIRPAYRTPRQVVTTRTVTRRLVPTVMAGTVMTASQPLYDVVRPVRPVTSSYDNYSSRPLYDYASRPLYDYASPRLYDVAAPGPVISPVPAVAIPPAEGAYAEPFVYRYVYEPNRILVIDPNTGIAVQAIPR